MSAFSWTVMFETEDDTFCRLNGHISDTPISDAQIRQCLQDAINNTDFDDPIFAEDIDRMEFLAIDEKHNVYSEQLNPFTFWPVFNEDYSKKRAKFRR